MPTDIYTIHIGGSPDSPEVPGFDSETCKKIWELFASKQATKWGRKGLGTVEYVSGPGYDINVIFTPESNMGNMCEPINCWMWRDPPDIIENWRRFHGHTS